jgi:hypothetical protein
VHAIQLAHMAKRGGRIRPREGGTHGGGDAYKGAHMVKEEHAYIEGTY